MTLFKTDQPRPIDRVIDYFGETRNPPAPFPSVSARPDRVAGAAR
jgi:hypothetical protein